MQRKPNRNSQKNTPDTKDKHPIGLIEKFFDELTGSKIGRFFLGIIIICAGLLLGAIIGKDTRTMVLFGTSAFIIFLMIFFYRHPTHFRPPFQNLKNVLKILSPIILLVLIFLIPFKSNNLNTASSNNLQSEGIDNVIVPANNPSPKSWCPPPTSNKLALFAGDSAITYIDNQECTIISIRKHSLLSIKRNKYGFFISLDLYDKHNINICETKNNKIIKNPNNVSTIERPDTHTLIVEDSEGEQLLFLKFLNPTTFYILGKFYYQGNIMIIEPKHIIVNGITLNGCFDNVRNLFSIN